MSRSPEIRGPRPGWLALIVSIALSTPMPTAAEDSALSLVDLEAYRLALLARPGPPAPEVGFRNLWDRPEAYVGRQVTVEGRLARLFHQPRLGEFPALVEAWIVSPAGDPTCLVFPESKGRPVPEIGASVRFAGTFLRLIRYHGGDVDRRAPLLVGPEPPRSATVDPRISSWATVDWWMGLGAAAAVVLILMRRHLSRPSLPVASADGPPPLFVDAHGSISGEADPSSFDS